jgi:Rrf2 family transcriptional regulator, iron-sulfur cluster assembly transcription factor
MLSNTCKYAIRATIYLAINNKGEEKIGIKQISQDLNLPTPFLGKIMQTLAKHKLLASTKGPHGGFSLNKNANKIKLIDIVEIIDGLDVFSDCIIGLKVCSGDISKQNKCPFHSKSDPIRKELLQLFKNQSIGNLASGIDKLDKIINL